MWEPCLVRVFMPPCSPISFRPTVCTILGRTGRRDGHWVVPSIPSQDGTCCTLDSYGCRPQIRVHLLEKIYHLLLGYDIVNLNVPGQELSSVSTSIGLCILLSTWLGSKALHTSGLPTGSKCLCQFLQLTVLLVQRSGRGLELRSRLLEFEAVSTPARL